MTFDYGIYELVEKVMENKKLHTFLDVEDKPTLVFSNNPIDVKNRDPRAIEGYSGKTKTKQGELIAVLPNTKIAHSNEDFEVILKREIDKRLNKLSTKDENLFKIELAEYVDTLIKEHKSKYPFDKNRDHRACHVAESFKKWLYADENNPQKNIAISLSEMFNKEDQNTIQAHNKTSGWTNATYILKKFFENRQKPVTDTQLVNMNFASSKAMNKARSEMSDKGYAPLNNKRSVLEFCNNYKKLIDYFGESSEEGKQVVAALDSLKNKYNNFF